MRRTRSHLILLFAAAALCAGCSQAESPSSGPAASDPVPEATSDAQDGIATIDDFIAEQTIDKTNPRWRTVLPKPPKVAFGSATYFWDLETNVGKITIRLMPDVAPMHASSTVYLTRLGFYDGLLFHRVIPKFMAQGGDPLGNGQGNPGYRYDGEFAPDVKHDRPGLLSMANSGPGTDGSQFFITFVATPHLNGRHTIFGEVVEGMDSVKTMEDWRQRGAKQMGEPLVIQKAEVRRE